jgi:hypothetical protein
LLTSEHHTHLLGHALRQVVNVKTNWIGHCDVWKCTWCSFYAVQEMLMQLEK